MTLLIPVAAADDEPFGAIPLQPTSTHQHHNRRRQYNAPNGIPLLLPPSVLPNCTPFLQQQEQAAMLLFSSGGYSVAVIAHVGDVTDDALYCGRLPSVH